MKLKNIMLSMAANAALGLHAVGVQAGDVTSWQLEDMDGDGAISDFAFYQTPSGFGPSRFGDTNESGCVAATDGDSCDPISFNAGVIGINVFTTGFNFGGVGVFMPNVTGDMSASIDGPVDGIDSNNTMVFHALDFGGEFINEQFFFTPDDLTNCTGLPGCGDVGTPGINVQKLIDNGDGTFGIVINFPATINDPTSPFNQFVGVWRLEGVMDTTEGGLPRVSVIIGIPGGLVQECVMVGGNDVTLNADIRLINGAVLDSVAWTVDGQDIGTGESVTTFMSLGLHSVGVVATAENGATGIDAASVEIEDTTAPDLSVAFIDSRTGKKATSMERRNVHTVRASFSANDVCDSEPDLEAVGGFAVNDGDLLKIKAKQHSVTLTTSQVDLMVTATDDSGNKASGDASLLVTD